MGEPKRPWWRRKRWRAAALAAAFVAAGYVSNAVTAPACERATARWAAAELAARPTSRTRRTASSNSARYRLPWLASVEYHLAFGDLGMEHGRRYYLCLFGHAVPLRNDVEIQA